MTTVVAGETALRTAIQRVLKNAARTGRFFRARYDDDGTAVMIDPDTADRLRPKSIEVNETGADFTPDELHGRSVQQRRTSWQFDLLLGFDHEVVASFFEHDVTHPILRVDSTDDHTYALLRLTNVEYDHPARDGSAGGSNLVLTWEASIGR